jgi:hypothetical protein
MAPALPKTDNCMAGPEQNPCAVKSSINDNVKPRHCPASPTAQPYSTTFTYLYTCLQHKVYIPLIAGNLQHTWSGGPSDRGRVWPFLTLLTLPVTPDCPTAHPLSLPLVRGPACAGYTELQRTQSMMCTSHMA